MRFFLHRGGGLPSDDLGAPWVRVEDKSLPGPVYLRLGAGEDGRLVCTGLLVSADAEQELTARDLRRIRLSETLTEFLRYASRARGMEQLLGELLGIGYKASDHDDAWRLLLPVTTRRTAVQRARPGRPGYSDDHYRNVARVYKAAKRKHPTRPIRVVMEELGATEPTVHRWLRTARDKGFITTKEEAS